MTATTIPEWLTLGGTIYIQPVMFGLYQGEPEAGQILAIDRGRGVVKVGRLLGASRPGEPGARYDNASDYQLDNIGRWVPVTHQGAHRVTYQLVHPDGQAGLVRRLKDARLSLQHAVKMANLEVTAAGFVAAMVTVDLIASEVHELLIAEPNGKP